LPEHVPDGGWQPVIARHQVWGWQTIGTWRTITTSNSTITSDYYILNEAITTTSATAVNYQWYTPVAQDDAWVQTREDVVHDVVVRNRIVRTRREREERRTRRQEQVDREQSARERAVATLRQFVGEERWAYWERERVLEVRGSETGQPYLITPGTVNNVYLVDEDGREIEVLCAHPPLEHYDEGGHYLGQLPLEDVYLHQLLLIQTDEPSFRRVANINLHVDRHRWQRPPVMMTP
jgi:hypothetical protein